MFDKKKVLYNIEHLDLLEEDMSSHLGQQAWEVCDLLMHGYGKRQVAKIMNITYQDVKLIVVKIRTFLESSHYVEVRTDG